MKFARHITPIVVTLLWLLISAAAPGWSPVGTGTSFHSHALFAAVADVGTGSLAPPSHGVPSDSSGGGPAGPSGEEEKRKGKAVMRSWDALRAPASPLPPLPRPDAILGGAENRPDVFVPGIYPSTRTLRAPPVIS